MKTPILTVGTFDGVHRGHKKILERVVSEAKTLKGESVVLTLHPHPRKVLFPEDRALFFLNTIDEKVELLKNIGIKHLIIYPFSKEFASLTSSDFIEKILFKKLRIKQLIVGYDHHFGSDRQGNLDILRTCTNSFGFDVSKVSALIHNNEKISSTKIRNALFKGELEKANNYLSYNYTVSGKVVSGNKIGRTIGFPTANIEPDTDKLIPANGVYAVDVIVLGEKHPGMLNLGSRPTITMDGKNVIEVHIFDFVGNLYDKSIKIVFKKFIRNELKFPDITKLKEQLILDKNNIISLFS